MKAKRERASRDAPALPEGGSPAGSEVGEDSRAVVDAAAPPEAPEINSRLAVRGKSGGAGARRARRVGGVRSGRGRGRWSAERCGVDPLYGWGWCERVRGRERAREGACGGTRRGSRASRSDRREGDRRGTPDGGRNRSQDRACSPDRRRSGLSWPGSAEEPRDDLFELKSARAESEAA